MEIVENTLSYINKKGKVVKLLLTPHAIQRFTERWEKLFPDKKLADNEVFQTIDKWFSNANRIKKLNKHQKERLKKYGKDTLFFKTHGFTFVVQGGSIVTIEISDQNCRDLN